MKPVVKKYLIAGSIGLVTIAGALAYLQYKKIMNYAIKLRKVKINELTFRNIDFNLYLNFQNKSSIDFTIEKQIYKVYINNIYISKIQNTSPVFIKASAVSPLSLNVKVDPKKAFDVIGKNIADILLNTDKVRIKVDAKLKVKLWFFNVNIPFLLDDTLKNLMTKKEDE